MYLSPVFHVGIWRIKNGLIKCTFRIFPQTLRITSFSLPPGCFILSCIRNVFFNRNKNILRFFRIFCHQEKLSWHFLFPYLKYVCLTNHCQNQKQTIYDQITRDKYTITKMIMPFHSRSIKLAAGLTLSRSTIYSNININIDINKENQDNNSFCTKSRNDWGQETFLCHRINF